MINHIRGLYVDQGPNYAVIECGGVGFRIYTSYTSLTDGKCTVGNEVTFYTYLYIKEGIMDLYGFSQKEELELFELLISVNGVGAKGALAILSSMNPSKLSLAIVSGDANSIKKAQGIGAKTAQRIILELKDKIKNESFVPNAADAFSEVVPAASTERDEAVNALISLGYSGLEAKNAVSKVSADITDVSEIIKFALKNLM